MNNASKPGGKCHLYIGNETASEKIKRLWYDEHIGMDRTLTQCKLMVETLQALKRRYFWWGMKKTITEVYKRQEEKPTAEAPLNDLQVYTFIWRGFQWISIIDLLSKAAMVHYLQYRSLEAVLAALRLWFQFYGVPERISSDSGREFDNAMIQTEMKDLEVSWHLNTPGHTKSRRSIQWLHGTVSDHLHLYQIDNGLEPDVAMPKAIMTYNHSVHTIMGFSLFEILFRLRGL
ncbi:uncharacterized protein [Halyomorpha halys]|uniref:uncharacterized protein n=1 Tax=Halyomorpha halys TaxID=286706 RepID=UPI0034D2F074